MFPVVQLMPGAGKQPLVAICYHVQKLQENSHLPPIHSKYSTVMGDVRLNFNQSYSRTVVAKQHDVKWFYSPSSVSGSSPAVHISVFVHPLQTCKFCSFSYESEFFCIVIVSLFFAPESLKSHFIFRCMCTGDLCHMFLVFVACFKVVIGPWNLAD